MYLVPPDRAVHLSFTGSVRRVARRMTPRRSRLAVIAAALAAPFTAASIAAAPAAAALSTSPWLEVSLPARGQPAASVLQQLQSQTGIVVEGSADPQYRLASDIRRMPLAAVLSLLLHGRNHYVQWGDTRRPTRVVVLAAPGAAVLAAADPQAQRTAALARAASDVDPAVRIEAIERLGNHDDAPSRVLVQQALADASEAVRAVAQEAFVNQQARGQVAARAPP